LADVIERVWVYACRSCDSLAWQSFSLPLKSCTPC